MFWAVWKKHTEKFLAFHIYVAEVELTRLVPVFAFAFFHFIQCFVVCYIINCHLMESIEIKAVPYPVIF